MVTPPPKYVTMPITYFQALVSQKLQTPVLAIKTVGGGCINETYKIITANKAYFCKINSASKFPHLFERKKTAY